MNLKKLNLGLVALLLGFGLVMTQSAFKTPANILEYTYAQTPAGDWVELDEDNFMCEASIKVCKGTFSYQNPAPNDLPDIRIDQDNGSYVPQP